VQGTALFNQNIELANGRYIALQSDRKLKEKIVPLQNVLKKIESLNGVSFNWKNDGRSDIGVIAQELNTQFPDLVVKGTKDDLLMVKYSQLSAVNLQAIKELSEENKKLRLQILQLTKAMCEIIPNSSICRDTNE
jgi:small-conductance mechanosensitive channel